MQLRIAAAIAGLIAAVLTILLVGTGSPALADGELSMRGVYYKERATRVVQPMIDGRFDVGDAGVVDGHLLVDAITSASVAAGADGAQFDERRYQAGGGYLHQLTDLRVGGQVRASYEPDYTSLFGGLRTEIDLADKNTVVGVGASYGHDWISNGDAGGLDGRIDERLDSYLGSLSVSQLLSRNAVASLTYDLAYLDGYQANPYRAPITGSPTPVAENHPDTRLRHAIAGSGRLFAPDSGTTAIVSYRFYVDDWGIRAHTPELRMIQDAGPLELGLRYRLHTQTAADFYQDSYPTVEPMQLISDDAKLSAFSSHTVGAKIGAVLGRLGIGGSLAAARVELVVEYIDQNNRFGGAGVAHGAVTVPFEY